jgi:DNA-binding Lrp family transcriptional regulator
MHQQNIINDSKASTLSPADALLLMVVGDWFTQAIHVAARLNIAELVKDRPHSISELSQATGIPPRSLLRLLRALTAANIFEQVEPGVFAQSELSYYLREDVPNSVKGMALVHGDEWQWKSWAGFMHSLQNEEPGFDHVYNMSLWQYFRDHNPRSGQLFNQAMTSLSNQVNPYIASAYDFSRFETLVDVGGGEGSTLRTILHKYPQLRGVLFDQAETIEQAREHFVREKLDERCNLVAGNFLEAVPEGADAYLLKHILEGWKDEMAISILHNCRRAMKPQGKILIVEYIVTGEGALFEKLLDLQLMITTTSGCRTEEECRKLFDAAGFAMTAVVETGTPSHIFEGTPI